jgi:translation initiation factor 4G
MHECVLKLLKATDEESLECLCRLMTTVGQELEADTKLRLDKGGEAAQGLRPIDVYFKDMTKIIDEKKTSSRVRFLMQDCVDLRRNKWQKRREDAGPKTIDQIHAEAKNEQLKEKLNMMAPPPMPPPSSMRGGVGGRDARDDPRKRSVKSSNVGAGGQNEDDWQAVPTRAAKVTGEKVDTNKIKNMINKRDNIEEIQLGPSGAKWSGGSSGPKTSRRHEESGPAASATTIMQNRFSAFSSSMGGGGSSESSGPPSSYDGRTSGGFSRGSRPTSSASYMGRSSRGQSSENDRVKLIQVIILL